MNPPYFKHLALKVSIPLVTYTPQFPDVVGVFTYHRINQLDTIVLRGIVTRSHHNTNPLAAELFRSQTCEKTHSENDRVEKVTVKEVNNGDRGAFVERGATATRGQTNSRFHTELSMTSTLASEKLLAMGAAALTYPCGAILENMSLGLGILQRSLGDSFLDSRRGHDAKKGLERKAKAR